MNLQAGLCGGLGYYFRPRGGVGGILFESEESLIVNGIKISISCNEFDMLQPDHKLYLSMKNSLSTRGFPIMFFHMYRAVTDSQQESLTWACHFHTLTHQMSPYTILSHILRNLLSLTDIYPVLF